MQKPLAPDKELNTAPSSDRGQTRTSVKSFHAKNFSIRYSTVSTLAAAVAVILYYFRFIGHPGGTILYPKAASCLMNGETLVTCAPGFTYPPFFAFVMIPFVALPLWGRNLTWYVVLLSAIYGSFRICEVLTVKAFRLSVDDVPWLRILTLALSLKFILAVFENQSYDALVCFFSLVGLYGLTYERTILASSGFALATALKATPVLFFVYLLFLRKWKILVLGIALCAMASWLPDIIFSPPDNPDGHLYRWLVEVGGGGLFASQTEVYPNFWQGGSHLNQSLRAFVFRLIDGRTAVDSDFTATGRMILYAVYVGFAVVAAAIVVRSTRLRPCYVWGGSVVVMSMLLLSPMSSKSHFVVLLLPYMAVVANLIKHREGRRAAVPLLIASFVLNTLTAKGIIGREMSNYLLSWGCITAGTLLLLAAVAVLVFQRHKETSLGTAGDQSNLAPSRTPTITATDKL